MSKVSKFEKGMLIVGFVGVVLLIPGLLLALGYDLSFLEGFGLLEHKELVTLCGLGFIGLTAVFGGGDNVSSVFLGLLTGFLLIATALNIGFMDWYRELVKDVAMFSSQPLNYVTGLSVILLGLLMSFATKTKFWQELLILAALPLVWVYACFSMNWFQSDAHLNISMDKGYQELASVIDAKYKQMPNVNAYLEDLFASKELSEEEKKMKLLALKEKIEKMEDDKKILEALRKENLTFQDLLNSQEKKLGKKNWCEGTLNDNDTIASFEVAVRPGKTCVRDFAVSLIAHAGSYYAEGSHLKPSETGIFQVADIHTYLSSRWKYVNDPTLLLSDYMSPADHTIAIGFRGDCDDYSILMASAVEAIGGAVRIASGECQGGAHAWCEVFIGEEKDKKQAELALEAYYGAKAQRITFSKDEKGDYWLPLDWQMGRYTCNDTAGRNLYVSKHFKLKR